jgi:hypothetical protein
MSDDLVKRLRDPAFGTETSERLLMVAAADRIEALTKELARSTRLISKMVPLSSCGNYVFWDGVGDIELDHNGELRSRIEALTAERDEAARADAKKAEAYAEELEKELNICRMAQVVMENGIAEAEKERDEWKSLAEAAIKDDASKNIYYAELKAKLAKAVEAIRNVVEEYDLFRKNEYERGLSPLDDEIHAARTTLAEIEGEKT